MQSSQQLFAANRPHMVPGVGLRSAVHAVENRRLTDKLPITWLCSAFGLPPAGSSLIALHSAVECEIRQDRNTSEAVFKLVLCPPRRFSGPTFRDLAAGPSSAISDEERCW